MSVKSMDGAVGEIRQDSKLKNGGKLIICLNRACGSMLEDACLLTADGKLPAGDSH